MRAQAAETPEAGPAPQPPLASPPIELVVDLSPDTQIEHAIEVDRASEGGDLLDRNRPRE